MANQPENQPEQNPSLNPLNPLPSTTHVEWPDWKSDPQTTRKEHWRIEQAVLGAIGHHQLDRRFMPHLDQWIRAMLVMGSWACIPPITRPWTADEFRRGKNLTPLIVAQLRWSPQEVLDKWNGMYEAHMIPLWVADGPGAIARGLIDLYKELRILHETKFPAEGKESGEAGRYQPGEVAVGIPGLKLIDFEKPQFRHKWESFPG